MAKSAETYASYYTTLVSGLPITCASTGTLFPTVTPPSAAILDFIAVREVHATRSVSGDQVPIIVMNFTPAAPFVRLFGPENMGGMGDLGARVDAEVERSGKDAETVGAEIYYRAIGEAINIPGLPTMRDYEAFPQQGPKGPMAMFLRAGYGSIMQSDGLILTTCKAYETSGSLDALKAYRTDSLGKPTFALGPLVPVNYNRTPSASNSDSSVNSRTDNALKTFLDDKLQKFGENSVLYWSFGTMNWPSSLENVEEVIDCLIETKMPFIFCHAAPTAHVPDALFNKVGASGLGYLSKWAPQHYVLTHPATGWYLTHCGWGGIVESLGAGVPMICWPFGNDQPFNAAHLCANLRVGVELLEVRTGECAAMSAGNNHNDGTHHPELFHHLDGRTTRAQGTRAAVRKEFLYMIGTVIKGERAEEIRRNAQRLQREFAREWEDKPEGEGGAGSAKEELRRFLREFVIKV